MSNYFLLVLTTARLNHANANWVRVASSSVLYWKVRRKLWSWLIQNEHNFPKNLSIWVEILQFQAEFIMFHSSNPSLYKTGGIDFFKFGNKHGDEIFFWKGKGWTKGGVGGGWFFTFILNFHKKEEYWNDFQFV